MKKILITGSNGLLGQKLVNLILEKGEYELIATSRGENRSVDLFPNMNYVSLDICNEFEVNAIINKYKPEYVINTAAMTNVDQCETDKESCWDLNTNSVKYLAEACEINNSHLIHLSTDFIFDGKEGPYREDAKPNPISYYGESKLAAEEILNNSNCKSSILRTVLVYGISNDMSRSNIILWVKSSLEDGKNIKVVNDQWRTPTLAEDLAMGCYLTVEKDAVGIFNISGKDFLNPYQMAIKTADFFKLDKSLIEEVDGTQFSQTAKRPPKTGFKLDKAITELGFKPVSFDEGIEVLAGQIGL